MSIRQLRFLLIGVVGVGSVQAAEVGWVLEYTPISAAHRVERQAASIHLGLGTSLLAGDVINVVEGGHVLVGFIDGSERQFSGNGKWTLPAVERSSAIWSAMQSLLGMVDRQGQLAASASTRDPGACITTEGNPIRLPLFNRPQKLVAGVQSLPIAWEGGCPNFSLSVNAGGSTLASRDTLKERSVVLGNLDLKPGKHSLRLDSRSHSIDLDFEVVSYGPTKNVVTARSPTMQRLLHAVWLADQEHGAWRAETLKLLQPLLDERQPIATRLAELLLFETPIAENHHSP